jgi:hypothetical protein
VPKDIHGIGPSSPPRSSSKMTTNTALIATFCSFSSLFGNKSSSAYIYIPTYTYIVFRKRERPARLARYIYAIHISFSSCEKKCFHIKNVLHVVCISSSKQSTCFSLFFSLLFYFPCLITATIRYIFQQKVEPVPKCNTIPYFTRSHPLNFPLIIVQSYFE